MSTLGPVRSLGRARRDTEVLRSARGDIGIVFVARSSKAAMVAA
jgi:hypothetical protein